MVSMEEARWGAVCPDTFWAFAHDWRQALTFQGKSGSVFTSFTSGKTGSRFRVIYQPAIVRSNKYTLDNGLYSMLKEPPSEDLFGW